MCFRPRVSPGIVFNWAVLLLGALLPMAGTANAQATLTVTGTTDGIAFQIPVTPTSLLAGGLTQTFNVTATSLPAGYACTAGACQAGYNAAGGVLRLTTNPVGLGGATLQNTFTWGFPQFIHSGVYTAPGGSGFEAGTLIVSGLDATAGAPQTNATGATFAVPLQVTATLPNPAYLNAVTVTFTAPGAGPSATLPGGGVATTNGQGEATITPTANGAAGVYLITASATVNSQTVGTVFLATNLNTTNASGGCVVTNGNDDLSAGSLRSQVATCGKGGDITFAGGVTAVNLGQFQDIQLTQDLTIDGGGTVTINGNSSRIFFVSGGTITLKNLTLNGGSASGGAGGDGRFQGGGGGAAGMGGAIFLNGGSLTVDTVAFTNNTASGGNGGTAAAGGAGGGGGAGGPGGTITPGTSANGGGGADFGSTGGVGGNPGSSSASGAGGAAEWNGGGGSGGFGGGGGGGTLGGQGGFGGGGGGLASPAGGTFAGNGSSGLGGGGGAGLGGAIFANAGTLQLIGDTFTSNTATGGAAGDGNAGTGQGKGGAIFINSTATATVSGTAPAFSQNTASNAGTSTICNTVLLVTAQDTNDVCGALGPGPATHLSVTAPGVATGGMAFSVTVTALDALNNTATGYTGTVQFTSTDTASVLPGNYTFTVADAGVHTFANGVVLNTSGVKTITTTDTVTGTITGTSGNITVAVAAPTISASFSPTTVEVGGDSILTITVTNSNASEALSSVSFSDTMPAGLTLVTQTGGTCGTVAATGGGTTNLNPGAGTFSSTSNSLAAGQSCNITLQVRGATAGLKTDTTSAVSATESSPGLTASALLTVNADAPPTIAESFTPNSIAFDGTSSLSFTIANPNTTISLTGIAFSDTLPAGVVVSTPNGLSGSCGGGAITAVAGSSSLSLSGATLAASTQCTFSVSVTGTGAGANNNVTGNVTSTQSGAGLTGSATLSVAPPPATHFSVNAPGAATAGTSFNVTVTALDAFNSTAAAYSGTVHFTSTDGLAVLPADTTLTNGIGTLAVTLKTAGTQTVTATDTVSSITGTSGNVTISPAAVSHFSVAAPGAETAGTSFSFTVTALDPFNNTATGYTGTLGFTSSDGQASLPGNMTLTNGTGTFSATLKTAGNQTITATDTVTAAITGTSSNVAISAASGMTLSVSAPVSATAGTSFNFTVTAIDHFGNTAPTYSGTVHFTSSDGTAMLPADATLTNGVGTFAATLKTAGNQTITGTDTVTASIHGSSNTITVSGAAATHLTVVAPGSATAGTSFSFTVTALDQFNNTSAGYTGTVHFTSSDGAAVLPADLTLTNGTANLSATLKTEAIQTITATDTVSVAINGTTGNITVNPAAAAHFLVAAPGAATAGTAFNFTVTAQDAFNNLVAGYAGTVHFTSTDGIAALPVNSTLTNGTGTFSTTLKTAGVQTITATDTVSPGFTGVSSGVTVSAGAATHLTVTAPGASTAGIALNFTVTALDQFNNTATGYVGTVHFTSSDGIAAVPADATLTNGTGTLSATLKTAGNKTISATDTVTNSITGTSGTIMVSAGPATSLKIVAQSNATAGVSTSFTVRARDNFDNTATSYAGTIHFTSTDAGATLPANSTLTSGTGSFNATLQTPGLQKITATDTVTAGITGTSGNIVVVSPPPPFAVSPNIVTLQYAQGSTPPAPIQTFTVSSNGSFVPYSVTSSQPWLVIPDNGTNSTTFAVNLDPTGLTPGTYLATLTFTSTEGSVLASVSLTVTPPP